MRAFVQRSRFMVLAAVVVVLVGALVLAAGVAGRAPSKIPLED